MRTKEYKKRPDEKDGFKLRTRIQSAPHEKATYLPFFNVIFNDSNLTYIKDYEVLTTRYLEAGLYGKEPLLYYEHKGVYQEMLFRAERGEAFSEMELAKRRGINHETLRKMIDRLEDCELVKRARLATSKNYPILIIVCTPFQDGTYDKDEKYHAGEIDEQGERLAERIKNKVTANLRAEHGKNFPLLKFDKRTMQKAIDGKQERHHLETMKRIVKFLIYAQDSTEETWTHKEFMRQLADECEKQKLKFSPRLFMCAVSMLNLEQTTETGAKLLENL